mgnify:CR=1 FL=1
MGALSMRVFSLQMTSNGAKGGKKGGKGAAAGDSGKDIREVPQKPTTELAMFAHSSHTEEELSLLRMMAMMQDVNEKDRCAPALHKRPTKLPSPCSQPRYDGSSLGDWRRQSRDCESVAGVQSRPQHRREMGIDTNLLLLRTLAQRRDCAMPRRWFATLRIGSFGQAVFACSESERQRCRRKQVERAARGSPDGASRHLQAAAQSALTLLSRALHPAPLHSLALIRRL